MSLMDLSTPQLVTILVFLWVAILVAAIALCMAAAEGDRQFEREPGVTADVAPPGCESGARLPASDSRRLHPASGDDDAWLKYIRATAAEEGRLGDPFWERLAAATREDGPEGGAS